LVLTSLVVDNRAFSAEVDPNSPDPASALQPLISGRLVSIRVSYNGNGSQVGTLTINSNATDHSSTAPPTVALTGSNP
jgi:hypothetical protein